MAKTKVDPKREPTPSDLESDYSSDDTIEDEDGEELTPAMDAAILRTLSKIRRKDGVYSGENILAAELANAQKVAEARGLALRKAKKEDKPFLLKDLHRTNLLEGVRDDDEDMEEEPLTNVEAERKARKEAVSAFNALADDESEEEEGFLVKRANDAEEVEDDTAAYRAFLLEMGGGEKEVRNALGIADQPLTDYREDLSDAESKQEKKPEKKAKKEKKKVATEDREVRRAKRVQADEDFLMDYILNRGWIDTEKEAVPTYEDIVGRDREESDSDSASEVGNEHPWGALDEEDDFDDRAEEFEQEYNFRFEEPGSSNILTHPRQIDSLVRREDDKRKLKREARAERKLAEKAAKEEEARKQKGAKRREMENQLAALKEELGEENIDWEGVEKIMDGEFDEDEWERVVTAMLMAKADREEGIPDDEDKPSWDDDLGEYGEGEEYDDGWVEPTAWEEEEDDDAPINMDADFIGIEEPKKKDKKKDKKARKAEPQAEDDSNLTVEERAEKLKAAAEDLNALQGEGMIGDLRTRFKYTKSAPQSFGLSPAEILMATDEELNELVSLKHLAPYRRGGLGSAGRGLGQRVRHLKSRLSERKWGDEMPEEKKKPARRKKNAGGEGANAIPLGDGRPGKRLGKKERMKLQAAAASAEEPAAGKRKREVDAEPAAEPAGTGDGKKKRRKKKKAEA